MGAILAPSSKAPAIPVPPPMAAPATMASSAVSAAGASTRARAAAGAQATGQNPTGPEGLSVPPSTAPATLLGQ